MKPVPVTEADIQIVHSGIHLRREQREKKVAFARRVVEHAIERFLRGLATPDIAYEFYDRDLKLLMQELHSWASNTHELKIARAHLARTISQHNRQHGTALSIPPPLSRLFPDNPLRSQHWSESRRRLNEAHERWLQGLDSTKQIDLPGDLRLGQFLYIAATYGGLCIPAAVDALRESIEKPKPIQHSERNGLHWIDLSYRHGKLTNATQNGTDLIYHPWLLTPMCKLAAFGYLHNRGRCAGGETENVSNSFDLIKQSFERVAGSELPFPSLKKFLRVAFSVAERQPGAEMTQLHAEYSIGRVPSMSLRPNVWRQMLDTSNKYTRSEPDG